MSRALDRLVAETLGWRVEPYPNEPEYTRLVDADGNHISSTINTKIDWLWDAFPHWHEDANMALALFSELDIYHEMRLCMFGGSPVEWYVTISTFEGAGDHIVVETTTYDTPAEAIVRAWLQWKGVTVDE